MKYLKYKIPCAHCVDLEKTYMDGDRKNTCFNKKDQVLLAKQAIPFNPLNITYGKTLITVSDIPKIRL